MSNLGKLCVSKGLGFPNPSVALPSECPVTSEFCSGWMRVILALMGSDHALVGWTPTGDFQSLEAKGQLDPGMSNEAEAKFSLMLLFSFIEV